MRLPWARTSTRMFLSAGALVSLPVFAQAPLVRYAPWVSLVLTLGWLGVSLHLISLRPYRNWGSLLYGFTLTWLAGSLYWGWLRAEPLWHMPIEAIALPFVLWGLARGFARIGNYFFLGSLFGTAITDLYIHTMKLLPFWRQALQPGVSEREALLLLEGALEQMQTGVGIAAAIVLSAILWTVGNMGLRFAGDRREDAQLHWWAFSGAVLFTLLVDGLFAIGVCLGSSRV
ncbi:DUF3120 domain-containing protein [Synechococcus sp. PCC 7336]|uniref:DUF3120 domain-containing protein n=1 Tax=Synechococcus sp. PCC 7336 TaxID=195250 RepID=UPI0003630FF4|nr:DUF3120 domain-containing protein [Synechococcus sp. PCC 7336]